MIRSIQFDVTIQAEKDTEFWVIPSEVYQKLMTQSTAVSNYTNELMASRFTEVMSRVEQFMWKSMDKRVAAFLLQEASIEGTYALRITHEMIANHLGSPPGGDDPHTAGFPGCRDGETVPGPGDHSGQGETARPCEITAIPYTVHCLSVYSIGEFFAFQWRTAGKIISCAAAFFPSQT